MIQANKNRLLVEGDEDKRVIPELIEANGIAWGESRRAAIVDIRSYGGVDELLDRRVIATELKASNLAALGILIDANDDAHGRWRRVRRGCLPSVADVPEELPATGLVHHLPSGIRLGVWIMPDNRLRGMLESFLANLVPPHHESLWRWTEELCAQAREKGAPFKEAHRDKARIYSWLSFQDPPGRQLHQALMERILDPSSARAQAFVRWFRRLYEV